MEAEEVKRLEAIRQEDFKGAADPKFGKCTKPLVDNPRARGGRGLARHCHATFEYHEDTLLARSGDELYVFNDKCIRVFPHHPHPEYIHDTHILSTQCVDSYVDTCVDTCIASHSIATLWRYMCVSLDTCVSHSIHVCLTLLIHVCLTLSPPDAPRHTLHPSPPFCVLPSQNRTGRVSRIPL